MASQAIEQPKLQLLSKHVSPVKDAVRSLEAQLASEGSSLPGPEGEGKSSACPPHQTSNVVSMGEVSICAQPSTDGSTSNPSAEQQRIVHHDHQIEGHIIQDHKIEGDIQDHQTKGHIIQDQIMDMDIQNQQKVEHVIQAQPTEVHIQNQQVAAQILQAVLKPELSQQHPPPEHCQALEQSQHPEQPQLSDPNQHLLPEQQQIQQHLLPEHQVHIETEPMHVSIVTEGHEALQVVEGIGETAQLESEGTKPIFKCVAVTSDGSPDWTKVMSLNKDILKEVLEKHGISMDTSDWPAQKDEDDDARKKKKKAKKAKKKKMKEKTKKQKDDENTWCDVCCRQFDNPGSLKHHQRMHDEDSEGPRKCTICSLVFQRKIGLRAHMRKSHPNEYSKDEESKDEGDFNCEEDGCERIFTTKMGLSQHLNQHHKGLGKKKSYIKREPGDLKCEQCDKTFALPHKLTQHMIMHSDERPYKCTQCTGTFKHHSSLRTHELIHSNKDACSCPVCGTMFKRAQYVRRHMIRVHDLLGVNYIPPAPVKRYPCEMCHRAYERRSELSDHMNSHTGAKPHLCEICAKGFAHKRALDVHRKTHTGKGAFHCDMCGKVFGSKSRMREHRVIHTGEKPFICQQCGSRFAHRANLREHLKSVHKTGVEPLPRGRKKGQRKSVAMVLENKEPDPQQTLHYEVLTTRPHPQIEQAQIQAQNQVIPIGIHQQQIVQQQPQQVVQEQPQHIMYQEIQLQPVVVPGNSNMRTMQVQQVHGGQIESRQDDLASVAQIVLQLHTEGTYTVQ